MKTILNIPRENQMKRNTEMFCANKPFSNSFQSESIHTKVLFFNFYILQAAAAAIEHWQAAS
jgi:hypothetical protein